MAIKKMSKAKYFYVYAVINFEQRLAYIGSRGSVKPPLEDPYIGSYDKKSRFMPKKKLILSEHKTRQEAYDAEREWQIKFDVAKSNLFVNKGIHTSAGFSTFGCPSPALGRKFTEEEKKRLREKMRPFGKKVSLKKIETGKIVSFHSINEAARELGIFTSSISSLTLGKVQKAGGYCLPDTDVSIFLKSVSLKKIDTGEIFEFESSAEASRILGILDSDISRVLSGKRSQAKGYCRVDSDIQYVPSSLVLLNVFTNEFVRFESISDAALKLEVDYNAVLRIARGRGVSTCGFILPKGESECVEDFEERVRIARQQKAKPKRIRLQDTNTSQIYEFASLKEASASLGNLRNLSSLLSGKRKRSRNFILANEIHGPVTCWTHHKTCLR